MMSLTKKYPYVLKQKYLQVTLPGGKAFSLDDTHPTFEELKRALQKHQWKKIPSLVNTAEMIATVSKGNVVVKKDGVYYKGEKAHDALANRILEMVKGGKPVVHLLRFMDNLYANPSKRAIQEFYEWLVNNDLPITDNGMFISYKSVKWNNMDTHTGTIDNSPGQVIMMARQGADNNWEQQCSSGFHICSKHYGVYGDKTMAVLCNPKDVLSAQSGKIRTVKYEVLKELGSKSTDRFQLEGFEGLEKQLVIEIGKERKELVQLLLGSKDIKRAIKQRKIKKTTILKYPYARLKSLVQRHNLVPNLGPESNNSLEKARKAAGLTPGEISHKMNIPLKAVYDLESGKTNNQNQTDDFLRAIADLVGIKYLAGSAISYPKPVQAAK